MTASKDISLNKIYGVGDLQKRSFKTFNFHNEFADSFGKPERNGCWLIWGKSGNGKTRLALQLAKYLATFTKVYYNTLEEGVRLSFLKALEDNKMKAVGNHFQFISESYQAMCQRLSKKRAAKVVIVDSLQYLRINIKQYIDLREAFPSVLFVFISHAKNEQPKGALADEVMYNADVKIFVKDFVANVHSRFGGNAPYTIWEEGYRNATLDLTN